MDERVQIRVTGHVKGVGFRYFAAHTARSLGIRGSVRNAADGVEAIGEGPRPVLDAFVTALSHGPHSADVAGVTTAWSNASGEYSDFAVVP